MVDRVSKADGSAAIKNLVKLSQILKFIAKTIMKIRGIILYAQLKLDTNCCKFLLESILKLI